jgi:murein L,D-transpeptidase YcbB/YkuD
MPIRINLLAEAQAAAEERRKNPVKRGIWVGSFLVCVVALWIIKLQLDIFYEQKNYSHVEADWKGRMAKYSTVTNEQTRIGEVEGKLAKLQTLTTNRFLWAPVFNALQKTMVDNVQVTRLKGEQGYQKGDGRRPEEVEKVTLVIEAKDLRPSDQTYTKYKENLCTFDFFSKRLQRRDGFVMDGTLGPLTVDPLDPSRQFVTFTLASHFPEARHSE